jgi:capsular polysaccharide biosynthesis protein
MNTLIIVLVILLVFTLLFAFLCFFYWRQTFNNWTYCLTEWRKCSDNLTEANNIIYEQSRYIKTLEETIANDSRTN